MDKFIDILPELIGLFFIILCLYVVGVLQYKSKHIPEAEKQEQIQKQEKYKEEYYKKFHTPDGQVCCPKCKSTQITMISRRWTIFSGFLTGKIDRACLNCKYKF